MDKRLKLPNFVVQLRANWAILDGDIANNIFYMERRDCAELITSNVAFDDAAADSCALALANAVQSNLASMISTTCVLESVDWAWNEAVDTGPIHAGTSTGGVLPVAGTNGGNPTDSGVSLACRFQTGLAGRGNHGRFYLVGINDGLFTSDAPNKLKDIIVGDVGTNLTVFLETFNFNSCVAFVGDQFNVGVVSFVLNGALRSTASFHRATACNLKDTFFDFQRRRAPAHARHG